MYKIQKKVIFILLILSLEFVSGCESCNNQEVPRTPSYVLNPPDVTEKPDNNTKQGPEPPPDGPGASSEVPGPSDKDKNDSVYTENKSFWDDDIASLKIDKEEIDGKIEATEKVIDSKLQQLLQSPEIPADLQKKVKQALENKGEAQQDRKYEEITNWVKTSKLENRSILKDIRPILENLKFDLNHLNVLAEQKTKIGIQASIKVSARRADIHLQELLQRPDIPADLQEKIKQALQNKQGKKPTQEIPMTDIYAEIMSLVENINLQNFSFSEKSQSIIKDLKLVLSTIRSLERLEQITEKLGTEAKQKQREVKESSQELEELKKENEKMDKKLEKERR